MPRTTAFALAFLSSAVFAPATMAQEAPAAPAAAPAAERVKQVIVYGEDPCPASTGDEIVVCARQDEAERYRIPKNLRGQQEVGSTVDQAWTQRVKSMEYVGKTGTMSCSPTGAGGWTGCQQQIMQQAKAERAGMGDASWADLVEEERAKRLSVIEADSEAIEARVQAEERARADAAAKAAAQTGAATEQK